MMNLHLVSNRALLEILEDTNGNILHRGFLKHYHRGYRNGKEIQCFLLTQFTGQWYYKIRIHEKTIPCVTGRIDKHDGNRVLSRTLQYKENG